MCVTSLDEQRRTDWMTSESLAEFLDPNDRSKTIEGYPAPLRAVLTAKTLAFAYRPAPARIYPLSTSTIRSSYTMVAFGGICGA